LVFFAAIGLWQLTIAVWDLSPLVLPSPEAVGQAFVEMFKSGVIWPHLLTTLQEIILGFAAGVVLGVGLAVLLTQVPPLMRIANPYIIASQAAPKLALAPVAALWFGFGITSKVVITALIAFFPLLENTIRGLTTSEPEYDELFTMMRASRRQKFLKLQIRSAMPYVFAGMRIAVILAIVGAVVGEYVGSNQGLGALVISTQGSFRTDEMFAVIILLTLIGIVLYKLAELAEYCYERWTYRSIGEER
jgi:NitT/TauT family transport system permease protein